MKFILSLCAVIAGTAFLNHLAKVKKMKKQAHGPIKLDKMMLTHHDDCVFWDTNHKKCDCYMKWINEDRKKLQWFLDRNIIKGPPEIW